MRLEEVRQAFAARPFQPLQVRMVSGHEYRITTPESLISQRFATFLLTGGIHATIALEYIEEIRPLLRSKRSRNGRRPR